ncbi:MAG: hypothetical protein EOM05_09370 [Clostridia bacterium]|nr:hypothetical protein [Clostridia bacterium]
MKQSKGQKLLLEVARKNGVSLEEVRKEINIAIDIAMNDPDPAVQERWKNMKFKGKQPTPEEFVIEMSKQIK